MIEPSNALKRALHTLVARDPARERLRKTLWVTTGILCSVLWGYGVIHFLHADSGLLTLSMFLSLMCGAFVKDATARARVETTALLVPTVVLVPLLATALQSQRAVLLIVFVLLSGIAVWGRRFGARATAVGTLAFFAYFFTLFMHPTPKDLPAFCLIMAGAAGMQLVMKLIMWLRRHPERELGVMLRELHLATAAALDAASTPARSHSLQARLGRVDTMWRAITDWQNSFATEAYTNWDADTLALRVLDACVHTEEACHQLTSAHGTVGGGNRSSNHADDDNDRATALAHTLAVLDERVSASRLAVAKKWADTVVSEVDSHAEENAGGPDDLADYRLAECVLAYTRLREVGLHPRHAPHTQTATENSESVSTASGSTDDSSSPEATATATHPRLRVPHLTWTPWRDWAPTSRLAIQAMTATALAAVVGEAISATRWYWAVLTAFLVFLSTTTRSGILTRAYRRILGTVLGLLAGIVLVFLAHNVTAVLVAICLLCIMGMIYFAPLNYVYAAFFITTMLVVVYDMLGVLHGRLLEVRLEETLAGCICGVLCAYLLLSTTSRPALVADIDVYFDAVDELLKDGADLAASPAQASALLARVHAVEAAQVEVDTTISAMSAALVVIGRDRVDTARSLMIYSSRSSVRFAQVVMSSASDPTGSAALATHLDEVQGAVDRARDAAALARRRIDRPKDTDDAKTTATETTAETTTADAATDTSAATSSATSTTASAADSAGAPPYDQVERTAPTFDDPTVRSALIALARFTWVMHRLSEVLTPSEDRIRTRRRAHAL